MEIKEFQDLIREKYGEKDSRRGVPKTFMWLVSEVGELASALKEEETEKIGEELADVVAWTFSVANLMGLDVEEMLERKYGEKDEG